MHNSFAYDDDDEWRNADERFCEFTEESFETDVYRPFQTPADLRLAKLHGKAKRIGEITYFESSIQMREYCVCCHLPYKKTPFKLTASIEKYASLGPAFPLFFFFIKQLALLLITYFLVGGIM